MIFRARKIKVYVATSEEKLSKVERSSVGERKMMGPRNVIAKARSESVTAKLTVV